ncbi:MAG TPA: hypothetical protein VG652_06620 [Gaiellaceae bacterium]|nr:hypothetical protein [Gaiellaceae bacterium]
MLLTYGATACGGSKQAVSTTTAPGAPVPTLGGPTHHGAPGDKRAALLKARLTAAGYIVQYQPVSYRRGFSNRGGQSSATQTAAERARLKRVRELQQRNNPMPTPPAQILRVDITNGSRATALRLARELTALDGTIAAQGFQTKAQTKNVQSLIRQMRAQSSHELFVNIYNSPADTAGFRNQQTLQREQIQAETLQRGFTAADANIATPFKIVGQDVYIDLTREQIGPSGFLVDPFDTAEFNKFVAMAERKTTKR